MTSRARHSLIRLSMLIRTSSSCHGDPTTTWVRATSSRSSFSQASPTRTTGTDLPLVAIAGLRRERQRHELAYFPVVHYAEAVAPPGSNGSHVTSPVRKTGLPRVPDRVA